MNHDWEREYQNVPMPVEGFYCPHCKEVGPTYESRDYETMIEPNRSHPEWFHIKDRGAYIDIIPRAEFADLAVETVFTHCQRCKRTVGYDGKPIYRVTPSASEEKKEPLTGATRKEE